MTIKPERLKQIEVVAADGINGYNTQTSAVYCVMLNELLEDRASLAKLACDFEEKDASQCSFQSELWGLLCPDSPQDDRRAILDEVKALLKRERERILPLPESTEDDLRFNPDGWSNFRLEASEERFIADLQSKGVVETRRTAGGLLQYRPIPATPIIKEISSGKTFKIPAEYVVELITNKEMTGETATTGRPDRGKARPSGDGDAGGHPATGQRTGQAEAGHSLGGGSGQEEQRGQDGAHVPQGG